MDRVSDGRRGGDGGTARYVAGLQEDHLKKEACLENHLSEVHLQENHRLKEGFRQEEIRFQQRQEFQQDKIVRAKNDSR